MRRPLLFSLFVYMSFQATAVLALESDTYQPATLVSDDFILDFASGVRTYRGNVEYRQGSIRLDCDELVTYFNSNDELDKAVCTGNPAVFKQLPEGKDQDMIGIGMEIVMDQIESLIHLRLQASVELDGNVFTAKVITYDLDAEKLTGEGSNTTKKVTTTASTGEGETADSEGASDVVVETTTSRPSLTIQPRKKKKQETE